MPASNRCERLLASGPHREEVSFAVLPPCHIRRMNWLRRPIPKAGLRRSGMMKQRQLDDPKKHQAGCCDQIEAKDPHP